MSDVIFKLRRQYNQIFWMEWVGVNAVAELLGLGVTVIVAALVFPQLNPQMTGFAVLASALLLIATGAFEGLCVGTLQWVVLRRRLYNFPWRKWAFPTIVGALAAWTLGMLPSTIMNTLEASGTVVLTGEPPPFVMYSMAAGMGFILGAILGIPQWWALSNYVPKAGIWIVANALAWAVGMPIIFMGIDMIGAMGTSVVAVAVIRTLILAGTAVGAIHGFFLIWLTRETS